MNPYKKLFILVETFLLFFLSFKATTYAITNITLDDSNDKISVIVNSNDDVIAGIDIRILFSEDIEIDRIENSDKYCNLGFNDQINSNYFSIECFNDADIKMDGTVATIYYSTASKDYYFYVDQNSLDIGNVTIGDITDINKPEVNLTSNDVPNSNGLSDSKIMEFIEDNFVYIILGLVLTFSTILLVIIILQKKDSSKEIETNTENPSEKPTHF
ncbi:MAG: hypothetical protein XD93_0139 [candidate division WS6 bacterium 34_10]|uniref:Cohesin domain-containing protein n=1 Tax=candidate division WS6 bacterium 34_10 TaxID=1641389 RepID=A0A101HJ70_9BACT|nr:MAG: hypothetical protein XD93_0139 [candidate division WS6 bacterium 34_10]